MKTASSKHQPYSRRGTAGFLGMVLGLILLDQASKLWAISTFKNGPALSWAWDTFRITYAENSGAFLSLGAQLPEFIRFLVMVVFNAIVLLAVAVFLWVKREMPDRQRIVLGVILAGGIGNLIDRVCYSGVVIDFLNIGIGSLRSGIFNLADVWVSGGVIALFFLSFINPEVAFKQVSDTKTDSTPPICADVNIAKNFCLFMLVGFCTIVLHAPDILADTVLYRAGKRGGQVAITGKILDYNSQKMTFRLNRPDTINELDQKQILAFDAFYLKTHQQAVKQMEKREFEKAIQSIKQALIAESRPWVRRELMALAVECAVNLEQWSTAASQYVAMKKSDPLSRNLDIIPLQWRAGKLSDEDRLFAIRELTSSDLTSRLITASWLLQLPDWKPRAEKVLKELLYAPDADLRNLARCQLWRIRLASGNLSDGDLSRWENQLHKLPDSYWAGPMFLLAQGYEKQVQLDLAAARFLWLTIIDSRNISLTNEATLRAANNLESLGQIDSGNQLREEAKQRFALN